jgi:hypothetical protein
MGRSILAVLVGYFVIAAAIIVTGVALTVLFPDASDPEGMRFRAAPWLLFILGSGFVYAVAGGYVTAVVARRSEIKHALALGALMVVLGVVTLAAEYGRYPLWYQLGLVLIAVPGVVSGASLRARRVSRTA